MRTAIALLLAFASASGNVTADGSICVDVYRDSTRNLTVHQRFTSIATSFFNEHCSASGSVRSESLSLDLDVVVKAVPIDIGLSGSSAREKVENFCKTNAEAASGEWRSMYTNDQVAIDALRTFNQCLALASRSFVLYHTENHPISAVVSGKVVDQNVTPTLRAVGYDKRLASCTSTSFQNAGDDAGPEVLYGAVRKPIGRDGFTIYCERTPVESNGLSSYPKVPILISTSAGDYQFNLQADEQFGSIALASEAVARVEAAEAAASRFREELAATKTALELERAARELKDVYPVFVVGPGFGGALGNVSRHIRTVGCLRPPQLQQRIMRDQVRLACEAGYNPVLVGEIAHNPGGECGQTVVQVNCVR